MGGPGSLNGVMPPLNSPEHTHSNTDPRGRRSPLFDKRLALNAKPRLDYRMGEPGFYRQFNGERSCRTWFDLPHQDRPVWQESIKLQGHDHAEEQVDRAQINHPLREEEATGLPSLSTCIRAT
jgi:hypothetical protein